MNYNNPNNPNNYEMMGHDDFQFDPNSFITGGDPHGPMSPVILGQPGTSKLSENQKRNDPQDWKLLLETILGTLKVSIDSASEESQKILRYVQTSHSALQNSQSALQNSQSAFGNVKQELRETRETMKQELREIKETMAALKIQLEEFKSPQRPHRANQAPSRANPGYAHKLRHLEELQHLEALDPPYHERSDPDFRRRDLRARLLRIMEDES